MVYFWYEVIKTKKNFLNLNLHCVAGIKIYNVVGGFQDEKWWVQFFTSFRRVGSCRVERSGAFSARFSHIAYYTQLLPSLRFFPCYTKCPFSRLTLLYRSFKGAATIHIHNRQYDKKSTQYTITNVVLAKLDTKHQVGSAKKHIPYSILTILVYIFILPYHLSY